jgi:hypothetical protein
MRFKFIHIFILKYYKNGFASTLNYGIYNTPKPGVGGYFSNACLRGEGVL